MRAGVRFKGSIGMKLFLSFVRLGLELELWLGLGLGLELELELELGRI